jgi:uncharacterized integral membrane protein
MAEKITKDLLNRIITEIKKEENQKKIENDIINPILIKFSNKIYPYLRIVFSIFILNFLLVLIIFILIICNSKKIKNVN